jgi:hypothetical protein
MPYVAPLRGSVPPTGTAGPRAGPAATIRGQYARYCSIAYGWQLTLNPGVSPEVNTAVPKNG